MTPEEEAKNKAAAKAPIVDPNYQEPEEDKVNLDDDAIEAITDDFERLSDIPKELTVDWKQKYGTVFRIWFLNVQYVYRNFTYYEYKELRKRIRAQYAEDVEGGDDAFKEEIQKLCVLWPTDYAQRLETGKPSPVPGGIPFLLGDYILAASGFADSIIPDVITDAIR